MQELDWDDRYCLGHTIVQLLPIEFKVIPYNREAIIDLEELFLSGNEYEHIILNQMKLCAPTLFKEVFERIKKSDWKYYTYKRLPGAIIFLGSK